MCSPRAQVPHLWFLPMGDIAASKEADEHSLFYRCHQIALKNSRAGFLFPPLCTRSPFSQPCHPPIAPI